MAFDGPNPISSLKGSLDHKWRWVRCVQAEGRPTTSLRRETRSTMSIRLIAQLRKMKLNQLTIIIWESTKLWNIWGWSRIKKLFQSVQTSFNIFNPRVRSISFVSVMDFLTYHSLLAIRVWTNKSLLLHLANLSPLGKQIYNLHFDLKELLWVWTVNASVKLLVKSPEEAGNLQLNLMNHLIILSAEFSLAQPSIKKKNIQRQSRGIS